MVDSVDKDKGDWVVILAAVHDVDGLVDSNAIRLKYKLIVPIFTDKYKCFSIYYNSIR